MSKKFLLLVPLSLTLAAAATVLAACGDDEKSSTTSAAEGGELTVYSGRSQEYVDGVYEQFEDETGIKLNVRYGDSPELAQTIVTEGGKSPADVFFAQDPGSLDYVESEGLFSQLDEDVLAAVPARYSSNDGKWVGTSGRVRVIGYNNEELDEAQVPKSVFDLTDPKWKGKVGWAPTNGSFQSFVTAMRASEGETRTKQWLEDMKANDTRSYEGNEAVRDAIANGEVELGLLNHYYLVHGFSEFEEHEEEEKEAAGKEAAEAGESQESESEQEGSKEGEESAEEEEEEEAVSTTVSYIIPSGGDPGAIVLTAGAGVLKSSDSQEDAAELVRFLTAKGAQEIFAQKIKEYPLAAGIKADGSLTPLDEIEQPDVSITELSDHNGTVDLLQETGVLK